MDLCMNNAKYLEALVSLTMVQTTDQQNIATREILLPACSCLSWPTQENLLL